MSSLNLRKKEFTSDVLGISLMTFIDQDDEIWFMGRDVARMSGYLRTADAIRRHVDVEDTTNITQIKGVDVSSTPLVGMKNAQPHTRLINESGFYSLALRSRIESAKKFKRWVTKEVLPSIRKQGFYAMPGALESIKAIEADDVRDLYGKDRREFRKESKSRSDICKDYRRVRNGRKGGLQAQANIRRLREEHKTMMDRISELEVVVNNSLSQNIS